MAALREMLVAAIAGGVGSGVAKTCTYPLEISKQRIVKKPKDETVIECLKKLWEEGWTVGLKEKVTKSFLQKLVFFFLFEWLMRSVPNMVNLSRKRLGMQPVQPGTLALLCCTYLGEALSIPTIAPVEYIAVQVQSTREGALSVIRRTIREAGIRGFYRGWPVYLLCALQPMVQFTLVERVKAVLLKGKTRDAAVLSLAAAFWVGAFTKAIAATATYPINLVRTQIQSGTVASQKTEKSADREHEDSLQVSGGGSSASFRDVVSQVVSKDGIAGLYKGCGNEVAESFLGSAIMLLVKESLTDGVRRGVLMVLP